MSCSLAGVPITPFESVDQAVRHVIDVEGKVQPGLAVAMNAEKVVRVVRDPSVRALIQKATLRYADGVGVVWALRRKGYTNARVPGVELWEKLMQEAATWKVPIFLIGAKPGVVDSVAERLTAVYQGINIVAAHHGYFDDERDIISQVVRKRPAIVCVAMGSPRQELLMEKARAEHPKCFYMGVGGSFDVFVGNVKRAPRLFRQLGLEWFYRLCSQPKRLGRQLLYVQFVLDVFLRRI